MPRVSRRRLRRRFFANASLLEGSIKRASTSLLDVAFLDLPRRREVRCARKSHLHVRHVVRLAGGFHSTTVTPGLSSAWTDGFHSRGVPLYVTWWMQEEKQASKCINRDERTARCLFGHQLGYAHAFRVGGVSLAREVRWSMGAFLGIRACKVGVWCGRWSRVVMKRNCKQVPKESIACALQCGAMLARKPRRISRRLPRPPMSLLSISFLPFSGVSRVRHVRQARSCATLARDVHFLCRRPRSTDPPIRLTFA